jgi:hypothetical protein
VCRLMNQCCCASGVTCTTKSRGHSPDGVRCHLLLSWSARNSHTTQTLGSARQGGTFKSFYCTAIAQIAYTKIGQNPREKKAQDLPREIEPKLCRFLSRTPHASASRLTTYHPRMQRGYPNDCGALQGRAQSHVLIFHLKCNLMHHPGDAAFV